MEEFAEPQCFTTGSHREAFMLLAGRARRSPPSRSSTARLAVERLPRPVAAFVELQHGVDARDAPLEGDGVQLGHHRQDVLGRPFERGSHGVHPVAHPALAAQVPLDLRDVLACTGAGAAERSTVRSAVATPYAPRPQRGRWPGP